MSADRWTFLSNHGHVLISLARSSERTLRGIAEDVGITERAVQLIIDDLEQAGVLERHRVGRRNTYVLHLEQRLRHPLEAHCTVGDLVRLACRSD